MGYELKMHVGEAQCIERQKEMIEDNGGKLPKGYTLEGTKKNPTYFMENSHVDLCKCGNDVSNGFFKLLKRGKYCYFYGTDGDTKIQEDSYGDRLRIIPADKVLQILKDNNEPYRDNNEPYRRFTMAIALLEVVITEFDKPVVTLYRY